MTSVQLLLTAAGNRATELMVIVLESTLSVVTGAGPAMTMLPEFVSGEPFTLAP